MSQQCCGMIGPVLVKFWVLFYILVKTNYKFRASIITKPQVLSFLSSALHQGRFPSILDPALKYKD